MHVGHAGDKRREGADDGYEAGDDDGFAAVFFVEGMGFGQMALAEDFRIGIGKQPRAEVFPYGEVGRVAEDGRRNQQRGHQMNVHAAHGRNAAGGKEQRIARQEGRNHQAGFAEYNQKQDDVNPHAVLQGQFGQMAVDVEDEVDNGLKHGVFSLSAAKRARIVTERRRK